MLCVRLVYSPVILIEITYIECFAEVYLLCSCCTSRLIINMVKSTNNSIASVKSTNNSIALVLLNTCKGLHILYFFSLTMAIKYFGLHRSLSLCYL